MRTKSVFPLCLIALVAFTLGSCQTGQPPAQTEIAEPEQPAPAAGEQATPATQAPASSQAPKVREVPPVIPKPPAPPPAPRSVTLPAGTPFSVRTTTALTTKAAEPGDVFVATLEEPLMEGTYLVAPKGATVEGVVSAVDKGGRVKGVASLSVRLTSLTTADGQKVSIETNSVTREAKSTKKQDALKVGVASGIGAAVGAIAGGKKGAAIGAGAGAGAGTGVVLATRGEAAEIPAETVLRFELRSPLTVTEKR